MKNWLKKIVREVVFELIDDFRDENYTAYSLIEEGKIVGRVEMMPKPNAGDVINSKDTTDELGHYKFEIEKVELSDTGFTGNLYGKIIS